MVSQRFAQGQGRLAKLGLGLGPVGVPGRIRGRRVGAPLQGSMSRRTFAGVDRGARVSLKWFSMPRSCDGYRAATMVPFGADL